jgi:hypothetical protein
MGKTTTHIRSFIEDMKPLYYVAKILGIAPFTVTINTATNEEIIDMKLTSNMCGFTASATIFIVLLTGFVFATFMREFSFRKDPVVVLTYALSVPLNFIGSMVLVIMNATVNRYKLEKILKKFTSIDKNLNLLRSGYFCQRDVKKFDVFMPLLVLVVLLLSCEIFLSVDKFNPVFRIIERTCQVINLVAVMQYCKLALMIRVRLSVMYEILCWTFCKNISHMNCNTFSSGTLNSTVKLFSKPSDTLHTSISVMPGGSETFEGKEADLKPVRFLENEILLRIRRIYYHLYDCTKIINLMYGLPILIHVLRTAIGLISGLYNIGSFFDGPINTIPPVIIWTVVLLGSIISLAVICDMTVCKTKDVTHKLQALLLKDTVSSDVVEQLKLFSHQMSNDRITFTAAGLFDVNLSFLCTYLTSVVTYVVVLVQFKVH